MEDGVTREEAFAAGLPYFGPELQANQGDNHFRHFPALVALARETTSSREPFNILEIGSWAGNSLIAWSQAAPDAILWAVDAWKPYLPTGTTWPHYDVMSAAAESGSIEELFLHNIKVAGIDRRTFLCKGDSRDILPTLAPIFDIAFVDGDHRYSIVREDINACMGLVRVGGILCGDDLDRQLGDVDLDEHKEIMEIDEEVATTRSGLCYHHGVVQAVHDYFGRVTCFETRLWAVRKTATGWENVPETLA
jgi:predicted O-methyltransferase YrrM